MIDHAKPSTPDDIRAPRTPFEPSDVLAMMQPLGPRAAALAIPCDEHGAEIGEPCYPSVAGLCSERVCRGLERVDVPRPTRDPGSLERQADRVRAAEARHRAEQRRARRRLAPQLDTKD